MATRQPVTSLHPLTSKQAAWLWNQGSVESATTASPWWVAYFDASVGDYKNAYAVVKPVFFDVFREELQRQLSKARVDREHWKFMAENNKFPPDLSRSNPYKLPDYMFWWQAENAFRRGYMDAAEDFFAEHVKAVIREAAQRHRGVVTAEAWGELAESFSEDPVTEAFFQHLQEDPPESLSLKRLVDDLQKRRDAAYQQFSPYYQPLRSVTGAGFFGLGRRR